MIQSIYNENFTRARNGCFKEDSATEIAERETAEIEARLREVDGDALEAAEREIERAEQIRTAAETKIETLRRTIAHLENQIFELGIHRQTVAAFEQAFAYPPDDELVKAVFAAWKNAHTSRSPATVQNHQQAVARLAEARQLRPHVADELNRLREQETALLKAIRETAKKHRIDLANLVARMDGECAVEKSSVSARAKMRDMFASGLLSNIATTDRNN